MAVEAVRAGCETDHAGSRCEGADHAHGRILQDHAMLDRHPDALRGEEIEVGGRLPPLDMLPAAVDMLAESLGKAEMIEVAPQPLGRARRCNCFRKLRRKPFDELDRTD